MVGVLCRRRFRRQCSAMERRGRSHRPIHRRARRILRRSDRKLADFPRNPTSVPIPVGSLASTPLRPDRSGRLSFSSSRPSGMLGRNRWRRDGVRVGVNQDGKALAGEPPVAPRGASVPKNVLWVLPRHSTTCCGPAPSLRSQAMLSGFHQEGRTCPIRPRRS